MGDLFVQERYYRSWTSFLVLGWFLILLALLALDDPYGRIGVGPIFHYPIRVNPTLKNKCELKKFKTCAVYLRVRPFWIYTTVSFFKTFSHLPMYVLKILSILKRTIEHYNPLYVYHCQRTREEILSLHHSYPPPLLLFTYILVISLIIYNFIMLRR